MTFSRMKLQTTFMKARSLAPSPSDKSDVLFNPSSGGGDGSQGLDGNRGHEPTPTPPRRGAAKVGPIAHSPLGRGAGVGWFLEESKVRQTLESFWSKNAGFTLLFAAVFAFQTSSFAAAISSAQPPDQMSYQGYLVDSNGVPLGNDNPVNYDIVFQIYDSSQQGTLRWAEKQTVVFDKGQFGVVLGEGAVNDNDPRPSLSGVFLSASASDRYVQITVKNLNGADAVIAPRLRLLPAPYSFLAATANTASSLVKADGTVILSAEANRLLIDGPIQSTEGNSRGVRAVDLQTIRDKLDSVASGDNSTVGGGRDNRSAGVRSTVSGGGGNHADGENATVGGGRYNDATGIAATVAGGHNNDAVANYSAVGGGANNVATGARSTIAGGNANEASATHATVGGGDRNIASGEKSTVVGGVQSIAGGYASTVLGGRSNEAAANYSVAAGRRAKAAHTGAMVFADSQNADFTSTANNQFLIRAAGKVGINKNNPSTTLDVNGTATATGLDVNGTATVDKLGINKSNPSTTLDVGGTVTATTLNITGTATANKIVTSDVDVGGEVKAATLEAGGAVVGNLVAVTATVLTGLNAAGTVTAGSFSGPGTIPIGGIIMWSGTTVPTGWVICDGGTHSGIPTPDLVSRVPVGANAANTNVGGESTSSYATNGGGRRHFTAVNFIMRIK